MVVRFVFEEKKSNTFKRIGMKADSLIRFRFDMSLSWSSLSLSSSSTSSLMSLSSSLMSLSSSLMSSSLTSLSSMSTSSEEKPGFFCSIPEKKI